MKVELKRLGKKPFFSVTDEDGEMLWLVDFEGRGKLRSEGGEADGTTVRATVAESEMRIARSHAYYLLSRRDHSTGELIKKLTELPVSRDAAEAAVSALCEMGYVRDGDYSERIALHYARSGYGPMKVSAELRRRGFDGATVDAALAFLEEEFDYVESARETAERKFGVLGELTYEEKGKITAYLARRGFTYGQAASALE